MADLHILQLELRFDGAAPTGHVRLGNDAPRPFSRWVGLVRAVEELVTNEPIRSAT